MRKTQTIDLGDDRKCVMKEMRPRDIVSFLDLFDTAAGQTDDNAIFGYLRGNYNQILDVLRSLVDPPPNESLEDLSFSELELLFQNFMELNTPFFAMAAVAGQFLSEHGGTKSEKTSNASSEPAVS